MGKIKNIDLEEFIFETLTKISRGVAKAQNAIVKDQRLKGAEINPIIKLDDLKLGEWVRREEVEFDVSITQTKKEGSKASIGVALGNIGFGARLKSYLEGNEVNRIRFKVPIRFKPFYGDERRNAY